MKPSNFKINKDVPKYMAFEPWYPIGAYVRKVREFAKKHNLPLVYPKDWGKAMVMMDEEAGGLYIMDEIEESEE